MEINEYEYGKSCGLSFSFSPTAHAITTLLLDLKSESGDLVRCSHLRCMLFGHFVTTIVHEWICR